MRAASKVKIKLTVVNEEPAAEETTRSALDVLFSSPPQILMAVHEPSARIKRNSKLLQGICRLPDKCDGYRATLDLDKQVLLCFVEHAPFRKCDGTNGKEKPLGPFRIVALDWTLQC